MSRVPLQPAVGHARIRLRVKQPTARRIIVVRHLGHLELRIGGDLQRILARLQVRDVHPLAVNVVLVDVVAVDADALVAVVGARVLALHARLALVVLQAERGLVALGHLLVALVEHIEDGKHLHAVVMPAFSGEYDDQSVGKKTMI